MNNILIVSGHTDLSNSIANRTILDVLSNKLTSAEFSYLDRLYPDYKINVQVEQSKLVKADVIVLQFPVFWYNMPSLLSRWMEETLQHGFSHGSTGDKLQGKKLLASFTSGAPESMYHKDALMGYEIEEFLAAIKATCKLCGMEFAGYIYTGGVSYQGRSDREKAVEMTAKSKEHARRIIDLLESI